MPARTTVELHPAGCRLVEVDLPKGRRGPVGDVRVRTFVSSVPGSEEPRTLTASLAALRQERKLARQAWITIWGLRSAQQFLRLPPAKAADLDSLAVRAARKDLAALETGGEPASVAIVLGGETLVGSNRRREVTLVGVSTADVRNVIQPIIDAGFIVEGVLTPALALTALARADRDLPAGTAAVYVALTARATALAIVRDGALLFAREMPWGYDASLAEKARESGPSSQHWPVGSQSDPTSPKAGQGPADALPVKLAAEVKRSILYFKQAFRAPVESVMLCGDLPNLRALTGPLGAALDVPVKTLDSLVGIDALALPEPAEQFRAEVAGLRLAIATAADAKPPANLLPATIRASRAARAQMMRVALTSAASLLLVMAAYLLVQRSASRDDGRRAALEQQLATLEPEAQRRDQLRQEYTLATAKQAALGAFESQGPRLARLLEAVSQATPPDIVVTSMAAQADSMFWRATITGLAVALDAASGQAAVNALVDSLSASPFVGAPIQPPSVRIVTGAGAAGTAGQAGPIPEGMSGVEFTLQFELAK